MILLISPPKSENKKAPNLTIRQDKDSETAYWQWFARWIDSIPFVNSQTIKLHLPKIQKLTSKLLLK